MINWSLEHWDSLMWAHSGGGSALMAVPLHSGSRCLSKMYQILGNFSLKWFCYKAFVFLVKQQQRSFFPWMEIVREAHTFVYLEGKQFPIVFSWSNKTHCEASTLLYLYIIVALSQYDIVSSPKFWFLQLNFTSLWIDPIPNKGI